MGLLLGVATMMSTTTVGAQEVRAVDVLAEVGIVEKLETAVPGELRFRDHTGAELMFADLFTDGKPAILTLNYANCPMLCNLQLTGLVTVLKEMDDTAGIDFKIITVSINPEEKTEDAAEVRSRYLDSYGRANADWNFLVGEQEVITAIASSVGFGYRFLPEQDEFAHTTALILLSPEGKVSRYIYGIDYDPETLRLSLLETASGEVRSSIDRLILFCFQYDATKGRYAPAIMNLTRIGGAVTLLVLGAYILRLIRRTATKA